jgi:DNA-directed RNA polymerase omega subunit
MRKLSDSRGPNIDTDLCVENIGNRFDMVLVAAARARELKRKYAETDRPEAVNSTVTALLDIQNKLVGREYLKKIR